MAQIVILYDQFYAIRKLLKDLKYRTHRNGNFKFASAYDRKRQRMLQQQQLFKKDERFKEFFTWVFSIQDKLGINNIEFAKLCKVTPQTISAWKQYDGSNGGQFPSKDAFKRLVKLEIASQIEVIIKKKKMPLKDKGLPAPKVRMPRKRLSANPYY